MYKDGYLSYSREITDEAIGIAKKINASSNSITTSISNIKSSTGFSELSQKCSFADLDSINNTLSDISNLNVNLTSKKTTIENLIESENTGVNNFLDNGYTAIAEENEYGVRSGWMYIPKGYTSSRGLPMTVCLGGNAERYGDQMNRNGIPYLLNNGYEINAVVFVPQHFGVSDSDVQKSINKVADKYNVDKSRISLIGFSAGAINGNRIVYNNPGYYSTFVSVEQCRGGYIPAQTKSIVENGTTVIMFVGSLSQAYDLEDAKRTYQYVKKELNDPNIVLYNIVGGSHGINDCILSQGLINDMLNIRKGENLNVPTDAQEISLKDAQAGSIKDGDGVNELYINLKKGNDSGIRMNIEYSSVESTDPVGLSKTEEPQKPEETPKVEEPQKPEETPKVQEPKKPVETPKVEEPKKPVETPKVQEPKKLVETPKVQEPKKPVETPKVQEPKKPETPKVVNLSKPISPVTQKDILPTNKFSNIIPKVNDGTLAFMEINDEKVNYEITNINENSYNNYVQLMKNNNFVLNSDGTWTKGNYSVTIIRDSGNNLMTLKINFNGGI